MKDLIKKLEKINFEVKIIDFLKVFLIIASAYIIPSLIYKVVGKVISSENIGVLISNIIYMLMLIAVFYKSFIDEFKLFTSDFKNCVKTGMKYWGLGLLGMIISNLIINLVIFNGSIAANEELARGIMADYPVYAFISAVIVAPFIEEILFRKSFRLVFKDVVVFALMSGFVFGLMHATVELKDILSLLYIIPYGCLGVAFAVAYHKTKTIFTSIFLHALHNAVTIILIFTLV